MIMLLPSVRFERVENRSALLLDTLEANGSKIPTPCDFNWRIAA